MELSRWKFAEIVIFSEKPATGSGDPANQAHCQLAKN
jgi:hypothetical protein